MSATSSSSPATGVDNKTLKTWAPRIAIAGAVLVILNGLRQCSAEEARHQHQAVAVAGPASVPSSAPVATQAAVIPANPAPAAADEDSSPAPKGLIPLTVPSVSNTTDEMADVNWSSWLPAYQGYSVFFVPNFPNPSYRVRCWDKMTQKAIIDADPTSCAAASAFGVQSTTHKRRQLKYGYMPAA